MVRAHVPVAVRIHGGGNTRYAECAQLPMCVVVLVVQAGGVPCMAHPLGRGRAYARAWLPLHITIDSLSPTNSNGHTFSSTANISFRCVSTAIAVSPTSVSGVYLPPQQYRQHQFPELIYHHRSTANISFPSGSATTAVPPTSVS